MRRTRNGRNTFVLNDHNAISDLSGQKFKRSEMRLTWDNKLVGPGEYYAQQPQLILNPVQETIAVRSTRTQNIDEALQDPPITPSQYL